MKITKHITVAILMFIVCLSACSNRIPIDTTEVTEIKILSYSITNPSKQGKKLYLLNRDGVLRFDDYLVGISDDEIIYDNGVPIGAEPFVSESYLVDEQSWLKIRDSEAVHTFLSIKQSSLAVEKDVEGGSLIYVTITCGGEEYRLGGYALKNGKPLYDVLENVEKLIEQQR